MSMLKFRQKNGGILLLNLFGFFLFVIILLSILFDGPMLLVDKWVSLYMTTFQTDLLTKKVIFLTDLNGVIASSILFVVISIFFRYKKWYPDLRFFLFSFAGATLLFNLFKFTLQRARPDAKLFDLVTYSFPSGHTTMATVLALSLYFIFRKRISKGFSQLLLLLATLLWPVTIAFTRVYLNVHWTSDVLAGLGLGIFWVTLVYLFYPPEREAGS